MRFISSVLALCLFVAPAITLAQDLCASVSGATLLAQDQQNTYLGKLTASTDADSVLNEYGTHGSPYGQDSIWNENGNFGSSFGMYSAFNDSTMQPPMIVKGGSVIGYLSTNSSMPNSVTPNMLKASCG